MWDEDFGLRWIFERSRSVRRKPVKNTRLCRRLSDQNARRGLTFSTWLQATDAFVLLTALVLLLAACAFTGKPADPPPLTVSAASDLTFAFEELGTLFEQETGIPVTFNFGSTGQLAGQIENGAPVDVFVAAHISFVERLAEQGLVLTDTVTVYGEGRLVLWQRSDAPFRVHTLEDLRRPEVQRVAIANPDHAPYGMAAREALQKAGLWEKIQPKLVIGENVRQTLQYAETGNVDVAIVALALALHGQGQWALVPPDLYSPILQAMAVVTGSPHEEAARAFVRFVSGPKGQAVLQRYGFVSPPERKELSP